MSFFGNLFKRKKGGTLVGNLIRGVANKATGGILGNGNDLAQWEAKEEKKKFDSAVAAAVKAKTASSKSYGMGQDLVAQIPSTKTDKSIGEKLGIDNSSKFGTVEWFKNNLLWTGLMVVALGSGVYYFTRKKTSKLFKR